VGSRANRRRSSRLRPRVGAWIRAFLPTNIMQVGVLIMLWSAARHGSPMIWICLGFGLAATAWRVRREYTRRPAILKFWKEDSGYLLNVRHQRTGELLLRSKSEDLDHAALEGARLAEANLSELDMHSANLQRADLTGASLRSAKLWCANLEGANLRSADLRSADLERANLQGADLRYAKLGNAVMARTDFRGADLRGASFVALGFDTVIGGDVLESADFTGARWSSATRWPRHFDPEKRGCVFEAGAETDLPIPHTVEVVSEAKLPIPADVRPQIEEPANEGIRIGVHT